MATNGYDDCSPMARSHAVEQLSALTNATTSEMLDLIVAMDRADDHRADGALDMASWLVAALNIAAATARAWVRVAHALDHLPHLRSCFAGGELSWDQIAAATKFATPQDDELLAGRLPGCSAAQIEELANERRARSRRDAQASHDQRGLQWRQDHHHDGYRYRGFLPAAEAQIVNAALDRQASLVGPDAQTGVWAPFHQRCADGLVEMSRQQHTVDPGPDPAVVVVHVDADVLDGIVAGNGSLAGLQVPLDTVHRLLCDTPIEFNIDGPDGTCIGIGRTHRNPPRWLRRRIHRRDRDHCRFPGCGRKIRQIHHIQHWERDQGPTDTWNLAGLCWAHHHLVHEGGWTIKGNADHELSFTSPQGRKVTSRPPPLLPATRQHIDNATGLHLGAPDNPA